MPRKPPKKIELTSCPVDGFQQIINGKYKLRIVWDLKDGPLRYGEIQRSLLTGRPDGTLIAARVLSRELKALTEKGLLIRNDFKVIPPHVEYSLSPMGDSLVPLIGSMHDWSVKVMRKPNGGGSPKRDGKGHGLDQ